MALRYKKVCLCKKLGRAIHAGCNHAGKPVNYSVPSKAGKSHGPGPVPEGFYHGPMSPGEYVGIYEGKWFRG